MAPFVYIVDDDEAVRDSLALLLTSSGMTVRSFSSAKEFLAHGGDQAEGCLVFDLHMPEMSGVQLLKFLRARGNALTALAISGRRDQATDAELEREGAFAILSKPFDDKQFLALVQRALDGAS